MRALRYSKQMVDDVSQLVYLHLRFHGYADDKGTGKWTDSAVRRYVTDAGPLLERLHRLTRSDSTTRNARKAQRLSRTYDELEARIAVLQQQEELGKVRPELNGNEIAEVLGIEPGPVVGRAYTFLLELRLDRGPIGREAAEAELREWWAEQPESPD
jgi:poly(A) polymerase